MMSCLDLQGTRKILNNKNFVGTVFMDLSKAFDCSPHDLLFTKPFSYGLLEETVTFAHSYLKLRKQGVKISDTKILF